MQHLADSAGDTSAVPDPGNAQILVVIGIVVIRQHAAGCIDGRALTGAGNLSLAVVFRDKRDGAEIEIELKVVEVSERVGRGGQSEEVGAHQLAWRNGEA